MNNAIIAGHLGADPEVRFTSNNQKVTTLRVAARARRGGKDDTIWWRVTVWGDQFDKMISYFKKGSSIIVFGEMSKPEIFNDRDGKPQISMNMTAFNLSFSPFGRSGASQEGTAQPAAAAQQQPASGAADPFASVGEGAFGQGQNNTSFSEDDVPF